MASGGGDVALATTWGRVVAWRVGRGLLAPVGEPGIGEVVRRLCGVQAQVPGSAARAVGVRQAEPDAGAVEQALRSGELMRTWAVRGTLHLLNPDEAGAYLSLAAAGRPWEKGAWIRTFKVEPDEMARLTEAVAEVLEDGPLTRDQLVDALERRPGGGGDDGLAAELRSGWGAVLKPVAWQGALCHGPPEGNRVTFARPDLLLPTWKGVPEPDEAAPTVIPAYLGAYGPATVERFDTWLTRGKSPKRQLRGWFDALGDRLVTVDVEGTTAYLRAEDVDDLAATEPLGPSDVWLLPAFDQHVLGPGTGAAEIIAPDRRSDVSRTAGWIAPVVVAGGRVVGVWDDKSPPIDVHLFDEDVSANAVDPAALTAAVERMTTVITALGPTPDDDPGSDGD